MKRIIIHKGKGDRVTEEDRENILKTYAELKSIHRTSVVTGWSKVTVNKYVKKESEKVPNSRDFPGVIIQKNAIGEVIAKYKNSREAEAVTGISNSNISHCIRGKTSMAGGYSWERERRG